GILFRDGDGELKRVSRRKKAAPKGSARSAPGKGRLWLQNSKEVPPTYIAEIETVKLQGHVVPIAVDQAERRGIEVLIHGVEVKRRRIEGLVEGKKPVVNVGPRNLGRKRYAGKRTAWQNHVRGYAERANA